jgi:hypothetical protein
MINTLTKPCRHLLYRAGLRLPGVSRGHALGLTEVGDKRRVIGQWNELTQLGEVRDPAVANGRSDQTGEGGVGQEEPAAWGDPVRFVLLLNRSGNMSAKSCTTVVRSRSAFQYPARRDLYH